MMIGLAEAIDRSSQGKHFVLVHGASHGAWVWYKVATLLEAAGHTVTAMDLTASGVHPKRVAEVASFLDYCKPLLDFMESLPETEEIILVGHSASGKVISAAMEMYPRKISAAVFMACSMERPTAARRSEDKQPSAANFSPTDPMYELLYQDGVPIGILMSPEFYISKYYRLTPSQDYQLAKALWRYFPLKGQESGDVVLTEENYGSVKRVFMVCDPEMSMAWQQKDIDTYPPEEVIVLSGSDHMAMLSTPEELANQLNRVGYKYGSVN